MHKIYLLLFISYVIILALKSNDGFPTAMNHGNFFPYLVDKPFTEDGFYMMTVAWNIAEGNGIKYNLNRPTTGIQPLVTFIQAGVAKAVMLFGGGKMEFLRVMIIFSSFMLFLFSLVVGSITKKIVPLFYSRTIVMLLVLFCFELSEYFSNGLETGFYLILMGICIRYSIYFIEKPGYKQAFIFGLLSGITALTRVDFLLPLFVYLVILFVLKKTNIVRSIIVLITAVIILFPWLIYVYSLTGSIYPSSVSSQTILISSLSFGERIYHITRSFLHHLTPFVYTYNLFISVGAVFIYGVILYYLIKRFRLFEAFEKASFNNLITWGISFFILGITYFIYSSAQHFYIRYTSPFYLIILVITVCCLLFILNKITGIYKNIFFAALVLFFFANAYYYQFNKKLANHLTLRIAYIENNIDETEKIGLFQSGVTGFFVGNVINLDGKVDHVLNQYAVNRRFEDFLDSMKVNVIIEWKNDFNVTIDEKYFNDNWRMAEEDIGDGTTSCFIRIKK